MAALTADQLQAEREASELRRAQDRRNRLAEALLHRAGHKASTEELVASATEAWPDFSLPERAGIVEAAVTRQVELGYRSPEEGVMPKRTEKVVPRAQLQEWIRGLLLEDGEVDSKVAYRRAQEEIGLDRSLDSFRTEFYQTWKRFRRDMRLTNAPPRTAAQAPAAKVEPVQETPSPPRSKAAPRPEPVKVETNGFHRSEIMTRIEMVEDQLLEVSEVEGDDYGERYDITCRIRGLRAKDVHVLGQFLLQGRFAELLESSQ